MRSVGKRTQATSSRRRKSERKITRMVVVVVAVFVLCWLPFYALNVVNLLMVLPGDFRGLYVFVVALSYANSCANPILYGFLSDNFKRGFRKALCPASRRVMNNDRGGSEVLRPTEEWGGIVIQVQKNEGGANVQKRDCEGEDEGEEINSAEGGIRLREVCKASLNGTHGGATEDSRSQAVQRGKPEPEPSGHSAEHGAPVGKEALSSMAGKSGNSMCKPEESLHVCSALEISSL